MRNGARLYWFRIPHSAFAFRLHRPV